jgi:hypothetical protein
MAGEVVGLNIPTFQNNATSVTARNAEYTGDPLDDVDGDGSYNTYLGCNRAGSCAPGIGIGSGFVLGATAAIVNGRPEKWTVLDQAGAARAPQDSQHIGGDGLGDGDATVNPINAILDQHGTPDFADEAEMAAAVQQAAPGVGTGTAGADPVNRTNVTVEIGEVVWGTSTAA